MSMDTYFSYSAPRSQSDLSFKFQSENSIVPQHGVNVVLGGAMISGIIIMLFVICYCCHRNQQKRENHINTYWREPTILTSEIFTIDGAQLIEVAEYQVEDSTPSTPGQLPSGPPPPYDSIVDSAPPYDSVVDMENELEPENENQNRRKSRRWSCSQAVVVPVDDCEPPPSYERALKLQNGQHM